MKMNKDVRHLIQAQTNSKKNNEVDSPYAKYNSRGQLMCIVCQVPVKSKIVWLAHIKKRSHAESLLRLKEKQEKINNLHQERNAQALNNRTQPLANREGISSQKEPTAYLKPKGILKKVAEYSSSSDEDESPPLKKIKSEIPDSSVQNDVNMSDGEPKLQQPSKDEEVLPEGFFDDPVADAKARNVPYKDKNVEEWEAFMREVNAAEVQSQQIIAEDKEEAAIATQLEQTEEQIKCLGRIVELDRAKQTQLQLKKSQMKESLSDESSDEDFSPVIWRTKNSFI